jgi:hypothetical protein
VPGYEIAEAFRLRMLPKHGEQHLQRLCLVHVSEGARQAQPFDESIAEEAVQFLVEQAFGGLDIIPHRQPVGR